MSPHASDDAVPQQIHHDSWAPGAPRLPGRPAVLADGTRPVPTRRSTDLRAAFGGAARPGKPGLAITKRMRIAMLATCVLAVGATIAVFQYTRATEREALEAKLPIVAGPATADVFDREVPRWTAGRPKLLRALAAFQAPALDSLVGAGACRFSGIGATFTAGSDLAAEVGTYIDQSVSAAARGRFATVEAEAELVAALTGPVIVRTDSASYAFDPATGTLACAGSHDLRAVQ
ncbi:MAG: hypothetical protein H0T46_16115 [Deltaproteobacteria bacterium]|nr:hypothetical protein [Deltaproteobacteria bacterium]